jgi:hypothetical protein
MGLAGMAVSAVSVAVGAIMYWAITYQGTGFRFSTVGVILMIVGFAGFVVSSIVFGISRTSPGGSHHTLDRQVSDTDGRASSVHEETT